MLKPLYEAAAVKELARVHQPGGFGDHLHAKHHNLVSFISLAIIDAWPLQRSGNGSHIHSCVDWKTYGLHKGALALRCTKQPCAVRHVPPGRWGTETRQGRCGVRSSAAPPAASRVWRACRHLQGRNCTYTDRRDQILLQHHTSNHALQLGAQALAEKQLSLLSNALIHAVSACCGQAGTGCKRVQIRGSTFSHSYHSCQCARGGPPTSATSVSNTHLSRCVPEGCSLQIRWLRCNGSPVHAALPGACPQHAHWPLKVTCPTSCSAVEVVGRCVLYFIAGEKLPRTPRATILNLRF